MLKSTKRSLADITQHIADEAFKVWWEHQQAGTFAAASHLESGIEALIALEFPVGGKQVPELLAQRASHPLPAVRIPAIRSYAQFCRRSTDAGARRMLLHLAQKGRGATRAVAFEAVGAIFAERSEATEALLVLEAALERETGTVRVAAARGLLWLLRSPHRKSAEAALQRLTSKDPYVQYAMDVANGSRTRSGDLQMSEPSPTPIRPATPLLSSVEVADLCARLHRGPAGARIQAAERLREGARAGWFVFRVAGRYQARNRSSLLAPLRSQQGAED